MINIYQPNITKYQNSAIAAIKSGWISNHGEYIQKSTDLLEKIVGVKHAILMSNGTCATHCLFLALKWKHPEINKIYIPNNVYVAAWNAALMCYSPNQMQVMKMDLATWNIDTSDEIITNLEPNSAILIVHNLGNIINVNRIKQLRPDLILLEDNCEGFSGQYNNQMTGSSEAVLASSLSFYGNKIITSGEGGAFLTNNTDVYEYIKKIYSQGMSNIRYLHELHAYNYRMTNVQAALLYDQLLDYSTIMNQKATIFENYRNLLQPLIKSGKINIFQSENNTVSANWIFGVRLVNNQKTISDLNDFFTKYQIEIRPFFYPIDKHHHLTKHFQSTDPIAEKLHQEIIMIPSSPEITINQQQYIVNCLDILTSNN